MDFSLFYSPLLPLWYLTPLFIIVAIINTPWFKSKFGEFIVNVLVKWRLNAKQYHLIKNVTLPDTDGTTEIDQIIVSRYGVFVVKTKNMKGWIFGTPNQINWIQQIRKHKNSFQNPLHQNHKQIRLLESLLNVEQEKLHSVVVFIGDCKLKMRLPDNVTYGMAYFEHIKSKNDFLLSESEKNRIIAVIQNRLVKSTSVADTQHIDNKKDK